MNTIDLSPLYRNSVGFDRMASLIDAALRSDHVSSGYPPYNIESLGEDRYGITLAVAGFDRSELDITVEQGVLTVSGKKLANEKRNYLHQGIANRAFERKFNLADHVEVTGAELKNGMLEIRLIKEIPEAMKPKTITISQTGETSGNQIEHKDDEAANAA